MSKTDTFSNSTDLAVINEYDKDNVMQISKVVRHVYHAAFRTALPNGAFWTFI